MVFLSRSDRTHNIVANEDLIYVYFIEQFLESNLIEHIDEYVMTEKEKQEGRKVGCGCLTFVPIFIIMQLWDYGILEGFWAYLGSIIIIGICVLIGIFVSKGID